MSVSNEILNCKSCEDYARKIDPNNWRELFNIAWLKIREREIRDDQFKVRYYTTYFQTILRNCKFDAIKQDKKMIRLSSDKLNSLIDEMSDDRWEIESQSLHQWLSIKKESEFDVFLQNIITILLHANTIEEAAELSEMSRRSFFKYYKLVLFSEVITLCLSYLGYFIAIKANKQIAIANEVK